ncbi:hypothetical protein GGI05_001566, partial [Coemansia sp. RSA 2603]
ASFFCDDIGSPLQHSRSSSAMFQTSSDTAAPYSMDVAASGLGTVALDTTSSGGAEAGADSGAGAGTDGMDVSTDIQQAGGPQDAAGASLEAPGSTGKQSSTKAGNRKRARATSEQVSVLESVFVVNRSPASRLREDLAARLNMAPRQVQVWFQNRRAKEKTQQRVPRGLQHSGPMMMDAMGYANMNPEFYSMAMASTFMGGGGDNNGNNCGAGTFGGHPAATTAMQGQQQQQQQPQLQQLPQHQQQQTPHTLLDNQMAFAMAGGAAPTTPGAANPWLSWNGELMQTADQATAGFPMDALSLGFSAAAAQALAQAINVSDSRRESEMSGITAVASPTGPGSMAMAMAMATAAAASASVSESVGLTASSATSPVTTPVAAGEDGVAGMAGDGSGAGENSASMGSGRVAGAMRRPAPLALAGVPLAMPLQMPMPMHMSPQTQMPMQMPMQMPPPPQMAMQMPVHVQYAAYSPFVPDSASYMVLDAARLTVGSWHRVPMAETELTCLACVSPPAPKPVQRPGSHRPAELDALAGEFQWIIGSQGVRYKMVVPYSAISRIKFREAPDTAAALVDATGDTVANPQAALGLLACALKNPQARGELAIHVYDQPAFFFQADGGEWRAIGDFSENLSASTTYVHTVAGPFGALFCQLRVLLATCSRLKIAADPLMALWLGNIDDPYGAAAAVPPHAWLPCGDAVRLHSVRRAVEQEAEATNVNTNSNADANSVAAALPAFNMYVPVSAAASTIGTLTPTSATGAPPALGSARHSVFALHDGGHAAAAAAAVAGQLPLKTQRSASLPFIRAAAPVAKANPGSSLCRTVDGASPEPAAGNTPPHPPAAPATALPLRHRASGNHLRRPAPYPVAAAAAAAAGGSSRVNSPQMSPSPFWYAHNLRRTSRESLGGAAAAATAPHPGMFVRRESDAELALAMNNAFAAGDVFGGARGLSDLYGMAGVPPSPLSNVAMAAAPGSASGDAPPVVDEPAGMSNAEIVMAIFNAMNSAAATVPPPAQQQHQQQHQHQPGTDGGTGSLGLDPNAFMLLQSSLAEAGKPMDWSFDWPLGGGAAGGAAGAAALTTTAAPGMQGLEQEFMTPGLSNTSATCDGDRDGDGDGDGRSSGSISSRSGMHVDWSGHPTPAEALGETAPS